MTTRASQDSIGVHIPELPGAAPGPATTVREARYIYLRDLETWQARGWHPRRPAAVRPTPTGACLWVERATP